MDRRRLGRSDLTLSAVGFGCWALGGMWWGPRRDAAEGIAAVRAALDAGIDWFDTAPLYGHGRADELLAHALGSRKHRVVIATKVGVRWDGRGGHAVSDLSPSHVRADCEASLRRLGLDSIPLLQVHWPCDRGTPLQATLDTLEALREEGKVRWWGLCNYGAEALDTAVEYPGFVSMQVPYSILRREYETTLRDPIVELERRGTPIGVLAYEPLCRGLLTGKFRSIPHFPATDLRSRDDRFRGLAFLRALRVVMALDPIVERTEVPHAALAIGWVVRQPGITAAIAGIRTPEQAHDDALAGWLLHRERLWQAVSRRVERAGAA